MKDRVLGSAIIAAIVILSVLAIPTVTLADYDGGGREMTRTSTTTRLSTTGTMSVIATPEFSGGIDWILFLALASLVLLIRRRTNQPK